MVQLQRRAEQMKKNLEQQEKELEEKMKSFEAEREAWEEQYKPDEYVELQLHTRAIFGLERCGKNSTNLMSMLNYNYTLVQYLA